MSSGSRPPAAERAPRPLRGTPNRTVALPAGPFLHLLPLPRVLAGWPGSARQRCLIPPYSLDHPTARGPVPRMGLRGTKCGQATSHPPALVPFCPSRAAPARAGPTRLSRRQDSPRPAEAYSVLDDSKARAGWWAASSYGAGLPLLEALQGRKLPLAMALPGHPHLPRPRERSAAAAPLTAGRRFTVGSAGIRGGGAQTGSSWLQSTRP